VKNKKACLFDDYFHYLNPLQKNALKYMKEMVMFFVWVLSFSATIIITREGTQSFQFANLFQAWIVGNEGWLES
jgi:hypothetical protein